MAEKPSFFEIKNDRLARADSERLTRDLAKLIHPNRDQKYEADFEELRQLHKEGSLAPGREGLKRIQEFKKRLFEKHPGLEKELSKMKEEARERKQAKKDRQEKERTGKQIEAEIQKGQEKVEKAEGALPEDIAEAKTAGEKFKDGVDAAGKETGRKEAELTGRQERNTADQTVPQNEERQEETQPIIEPTRTEEDQAPIQEAGPSSPRETPAVLEQTTETSSDGHNETTKAPEAVPNSRGTTTSPSAESGREVVFNEDERRYRERYSGGYSAEALAGERLYRENEARREEVARRADEAERRFRERHRGETTQEPGRETQRENQPTGLQAAEREEAEAEKIYAQKLQQERGGFWKKLSPKSEELKKAKQELEEKRIQVGKIQYREKIKELEKRFGKPVGEWEKWQKQELRTYATEILIRVKEQKVNLPEKEKGAARKAVEFCGNLWFKKMTSTQRLVFSTLALGAGVYLFTPVTIAGAAWIAGARGARALATTLGSRGAGWLTGKAVEKAQSKSKEERLAKKQEVVSRLESDTDFESHTKEFFGLLGKDAKADKIKKVIKFATILGVAGLSIAWQYAQAEGAIATRPKTGGLSPDGSGGKDISAHATGGKNEHFGHSAKSHEQHNSVGKHAKAERHSFFGRRAKVGPTDKEILETPTKGYRPFGRRLVDPNKLSDKEILETPSRSYRPFGKRIISEEQVEPSRSYQPFGHRIRPESEEVPGQASPNYRPFGNRMTEAQPAPIRHISSPADRSYHPFGGRAHEVIRPERNPYMDVVKPGDNLANVTYRQLANHLGDRFSSLPPTNRASAARFLATEMQSHPQRFPRLGDQYHKLGEEMDFTPIFKGNKGLVEEAMRFPKEAKVLGKLGVSDHSIFTSQYIDRVREGTVGDFIGMKDSGGPFSKAANEVWAKIQEQDRAFGFDSKNQLIGLKLKDFLEYLN